MNIKLIAVGKLKERYYEAACDEFIKRLSRYCTLKVIEVADERMPESYSDAEAIKAMEKEGARILSHIGAREHVIALAIGGNRMDSNAFSRHLSGLFDGGADPVTFVIGGSAGLSAAVLARANGRLSLSDMTLPHRIARLVLLEQVYRAFKIRCGETYHK